MKKLIIVLLFGFFGFFRLVAEEGMLIPTLISAFVDDMQAMGMKLSAEEIYSVNKSSLKDAIMHFGGGCTAELVSSQGLLLTNHHCGYSSIQSHSSLENDYLKYGFWAKSKDKELPNNGLTASRMVRIEDVTESVLLGTNNLFGSEKMVLMQQNVNKLIESAIKGTHFEAEIKAFNYGNDYYLIVKEVFKDVRLVGTPPNSIGKFGGDTDNWVWPRHTGDFSVFRIYANVENKPADYNIANKPYEPLHFLPVSMKDRKAGDFPMIYGFPGTTEQHLVSGHLKYIIEKERPARISMRDKSLNVMDIGMKSSDLIRIQYASKQASIANGWKKWIGQVDGLKTLDAVAIKLEAENEFNNKAASQKDWTMKYGSLVNEMNSLVEKYKEADFAYAMAIEYLYVGPELFKQAKSMNQFVEKYNSMTSDVEMKEAVEKHKKAVESFFKNYDEHVDKGIFVALTKEYIKQLDKKYIAEILTSKSIEDLADEIYSTSILTSKERYLKFLDKLSQKSLSKFVSKDFGYIFWKNADNQFVKMVIPEVRVFNNEMDELLKLYVEGKHVMFPNKKHWPDANSTLRITYGKIEGSAPHDGMTYTEHTNLSGIISKYNTGNPDFELLPKMIELAKNKHYGDYAQEGELWVCFTGSNHTTGGNSGSPVIDASGNLIGLNFDRTWESTMSDYMFDPSRCRNITVDIRYVLWVMDIYSDATHLVKEMDIVR